MPNWCENDLTVRGPVEDVRRFQEAVRADKAEGDEKEPALLSATKIIPYPENYRLLDDANGGRWEGREGTPIPEGAKALLLVNGFDLTKDGFNQGGYEWCIAHWGTKWGFCEVRLDEEEGEGDGVLAVTYHFDTAWSPPTPLIERLGEMFPTLEFDLRYFEAGGGFNGVLTLNEGVVQRDESGAYFGDRGG